MKATNRVQSGLFGPLALALVMIGCGTSSNGGGGGGNGNTNPPNPFGAGPAEVSLGSATDLGASGAYAILATTGITNATGSTIHGDIGVSPAAASFITGFALVADATNVFSTSASVVGRIYAANYAVPTPAHLTSAISSTETAYTDAAGRTSPNFNELGAGAIGGLTLAPGLYKWTTSVTIPSDTTISGGANDVWIFQISGDLGIAAAKSVILAGGAQAKNIFWQVAGQATFGTTSHFEGVILSKTAITLNTGASLNGRALAQTLVALDNNAVTSP
jgi:hypothetical protein